MSKMYVESFKESTTMQTESLNYKFQKELVHNKLLPYAKELHEDSLKMLSLIKENLARSVMLRELEPGCYLWTNRLCEYIKIYGLQFSKEEHILFIKLMYELITIPDLDPYFIYVFASTLIMLLKKKELISPEELELPWRPIYELNYRVLSSTESTIRMFRSYTFLNNTLNALITCVKIYFPLTATQEILKELRPKICPLDGSMSTTLKNLEQFLPLQLPPKYHQHGFKLWFDEFMTLWEICHNGPQWENDMMWLMARLASFNIGYIDWEPHLPLMFTRFMRSLHLPVSYKQMHGNKLHKIETCPIAVWIVSVLGQHTTAQMSLDKFLKSIETYFHTANMGRWLGILKELLVKLPQHFILRLHRERYKNPSWETPIPENYKLTDSDIDAFVKSMMPIAMTAMFSKLAVNDACNALQSLATIRPNMVVPQVLERMYSTLDSLTEPHKLTAAMVCVVAVARPMVQGPRNMNKGYAYSEGPAHVLPLLFSTLPGIDPNDAGKCFITCRLISIYATLVPIVDSSQTTATLDEDERLICAETSRFEDFVLQFLDRLFVFIDSSSLEFVRPENRINDRKSRLESVAEGTLAGVCTALLIQTSNAIFKSALHKLRTFITERILETKVAGQLAAVLCQTFARVNGKDTLRALVPVLSQTILDILGEGGEDVLKEENLDNRLMYAMLLLSAICNVSGHNLLPHMEVISKVLDLVLLLKSVEGNKIACQMLKCILLSLCTINPCQYRSSERDYNDPDYPYVRDWGQAIDINSVRVKWYVPGNEEFEAIRQIFFRYLPPQIEKLQKYCENCNALTREELLIAMNITYSIIGGCELVLPVWDEPPIDLIETSMDWIPLMPTIGNKLEITMPNGDNVRRHMVGIMSNLQRVLLENAEDDTKSLFVLIQIWNSLLLGKVRLRECHDIRRKNFRIAKKMLTDKLIKRKGWIGPFILERLDIQHEARLHVQSHNFTETHKNIILEILVLATSRYADVRAKAQNTLFCGLRQFPYSYRLIVSPIIDILKKDTEKHHDAYKGALYILLHPQHDAIVIKRDWEILHSLWPAIVRSKPSEKTSVIGLEEILIATVHKRFPTYNITLEIPERCLTAASKLWNTFPCPTLPYPTLPLVNDEEIEKGLLKLHRQNKYNLDTYINLLDDLLSAILESNHWRHRLMAMNFVRDLVHPTEIYPQKIVRYFLGALIHDSLEERRLAMRIIIYALKQRKRKHPKVPVDFETLYANKSEVGSHNLWLQYNYETRPLTEEQWDESRYVHRFCDGYYAWPEKMELYAPSSQQPTLDPEIRVMSDVEKDIDDFFNDSQNIKKLVEYFSLDEKKDKKGFNGFRYLLFQSVFRNVGITPLKHFLPHLYDLIKDEQESHQRCAADITTGIIRGAKHWPFKMTSDMWEALLPVIRIALSNVTVETVHDWGVCFSTAQQHRDPNRHHWLLECLMEEPPLGDSESSFVECGRLYALQRTLNLQSWRVSELMQRLLARLENRLLKNPFQNVRERLGSLLVAIFDADFKIPNAIRNDFKPNARVFMSKIIPRLQLLAEDNAEKLPEEERSLATLSANDAIKSDDSESNVSERDATIVLLKIICKWIMGSVSYSQHDTIPEFYELLPILCQLENCETDEELSKMCLGTLAVLAQAITLPTNVSVVLRSVTQISKHSSWWARAACLEFLQVSIFYNMNMLSREESWVNCIGDVVLSLLEDIRLEVREKAGQVLGGLLHCAFIPDQEQLLEQFKAKARTRLNKKRYVFSNDNIEKNVEIDPIRIRHAGVLGLCAFIRAHPYDIPKYLPPIFEYLGFNLNDPQPIPTTIRKTLGDFKRTHYDGWTGINGHAQHFTEEQLAVLQDLSVPPAHYV